jgi:hypothetical protein
MSESTQIYLGEDDRLVITCQRNGYAEIEMVRTKARTAPRSSSTRCVETQRRNHASGANRPHDLGVSVDVRLREALCIGSNG